jgi:hypothetical protein
MDSVYFPIEKTPAGSLYNRGLSATTRVVALMARLMRYQGLTNSTLYGPNPEALQGPLLANCKFPDRLVDKAFSHDIKNLDLVLYEGKAAGKQTLGFERLEPSSTYALGHGQKLKADSNVKASVQTDIDRTQFIPTPQ